MRITKVVYFDESSVTDYMQIINKGNLTQFTELVKNTSSAGDLSAGVGVEISSEGSQITKLFKLLTGANFNASVSGDVALSKKRDKIVKNILENTILTDFLSAVQNSKNDIDVLKNYSVYPLENSFSYLRLASPYFNMMREENPLRIDDNFTIDISRLEGALKEGRGYYEFIGENKNREKIIIRFNIGAFRNNYTMSDITKMKLVYYGVKVGAMSLDKLSVDKEFAFGVEEKEERVDICTEENSIEEDNNELDVYDVLLAGVGIDE